MNPNVQLEDRLESLGTALRGRPRLSGRVLEDMRSAVAHGEVVPLAPTSQLSLRHRGRLLAWSTGMIAAVAAAIVLAVTLWPSTSVGWAEVTRAIRSQPWIRGSATLPSGQQATMWLAPARQVWAFAGAGSYRFYDGRARASYQYSGQHKAIVKLPLGDEDAERILPTDALSHDAGGIGPWLFGTEKIVEQRRVEVSEEGKTWIEFQMVLWRGDMNHATLRVDPETRLPVYLLSVSPTDASKSFKWTFDYPSEGPEDIYALGVGRDVRFEDRMPPTDVQRVLDAMAASRASIGKFRLIVGQSRSYSSSVVYRKGNRWRVESWRPSEAVDAQPEGPGEPDWDRWLVEQLRLSQPMPLFVCDGKTVWQNSSFRPADAPRWKVSQHPAPQDLMSGEGLGTLPMATGAKFASLIYPDLTPVPDWGFGFDLHPADVPGCVLLKRSAGITFPAGATGHEWYYVDPTKAHAVVRIELFTTLPGGPAAPEAGRSLQTVVMENFRQSPQGFWYPTLVRNEIGASPNEQREAPKRRPAGGLRRRPVGPSTTVTRYHFDFDSDLPDSLFTIDEPPAAPN